MRVKWNKEALEQLDFVVTYVRREFGNRTAQRVYNRILSNEPLLAQNPFMGPREVLLANRSEGFRSIVVHKYCKLVYYVEEDTVRIADLWDTRREPHTQADNLK